MGLKLYFVVDKKLKTVARTIRFDNWINPEGLHIDENENVWTTAFKIDESSGLRSVFRYLFVINTDGNIIKEYYLEELVFLKSVVIVDFKLIANNMNEIKIYNFH